MESSADGLAALAVLGGLLTWGFAAFMFLLGILVFFAQMKLFTIAKHAARTSMHVEGLRKDIEVLSRWVEHTAQLVKHYGEGGNITAADSADPPPKPTTASDPAPEGIDGQP